MKPGDIVRLARATPRANGDWDRFPAAQAALVSLDPEDGAIRALVGGFQVSPAASSIAPPRRVARQPGSGFKPFLYSAAFDTGFSASILNDAPIPRSFAPGRRGRRPTMTTSSKDRCACAKRWSSQSTSSPCACSTPSGCVTPANTSRVSGCRWRHSRRTCPWRWGTASVSPLLMARGAMQCSPTAACWSTLFRRQHRGPGRFGGVSRRSRSRLPRLPGAAAG